MSRVTAYSISLLHREECRLRYTPNQFVEFLRAWRKSHAFASTCSKCEQPLPFGDVHFTICCGQFYFNDLLSTYPVESIVVDTRGYEFILPQMKRILLQQKSSRRDHPSQDYLVIPDPIYWQLASTLEYDKVMKFVRGLPISKRTEVVLPATNSPVFYKQLEQAPLNYGSLNYRSSGKTTFIRQYVFGKRSTRSMRAMIVGDPSLRPNEIVLPERVVKKFLLLGRWIVLNRMPTLHPENFMALRVSRAWDNDCIGIPLEIVESMNADFDGDECNLYMLNSLQAQAECETVLNAEMEMGSLTTGLVLAPSQDMIVAYYLYRDEINFLPYKCRDLRRTFRVIYDLYGSRRAFESFDAMRLFYLDVLQRHHVFGITLSEIRELVQLSESAVCGSGRHDAVNVLKTKVHESRKNQERCLIAQVESGAKGSYAHLLQMFGAVGYQNGAWIGNSFWRGLTASEAVEHAVVSHDALSQTDKIWQPGYGYTKMAYNMQGMHVDYRGQLVDGSIVVETDALDVLHHTDLLSEEAFDVLMNQELLTPEESNDGNL